MSITNNFCAFIDDLRYDVDDVITTCREITKKLNDHYYDLSCDHESHFYFVGSIGRKTAVKSTSDIDIIFDLPQDVYKRFDEYESNGQSSLLQEVRDILQERYSKTKIRGDGQVVVIEFDKYTVELVPAFLQQDNTFLYPDTHDGGKWKKTDPFSEQQATRDSDEQSGGIFCNVCRLVRAWKNEKGIKCGGLLIDSLCFNVFSNHNYYTESGTKDYYSIMTDVFEYFMNLNKDQTFWYALGSNQKVYSKDNSFINKSHDAYEILSSAIDITDKQDALVEVFGNRFPCDNTRCVYEAGINTEEYIENKFPVDVRYSLSIDCTVSQNGFREYTLRRMLVKKILLRHNKQLLFSIEECDVPKPYDIYWKVRNVGPVAIKKKMIRGQVVKTNSITHKESTSFQGPHYVECYIVKNGVCVARDRIDVPIGCC